MSLCDVDEYTDEMNRIDWKEFGANLEFVSEHSDELRRKYAGRYLVVHSRGRVIESFSTRRMLLHFFRKMPAEKLRQCYSEYIPGMNETLGM